MMMSPRLDLVVTSPTLGTDAGARGVRTSRSWTAPLKEEGVGSAIADDKHAAMMREVLKSIVSFRFVTCRF